MCRLRFFIIGREGTVGKCEDVVGMSGKGKVVRIINWEWIGVGEI